MNYKALGIILSIILSTYLLGYVIIFDFLGKPCASTPTGMSFGPPPRKIILNSRYDYAEFEFADHSMMAYAVDSDSWYYIVYRPVNIIWCSLNHRIWNC